MSKITKAILQKQNAELQNKIVELEKERSSLLKDNTELKIKVQFYEALPQNVCNTVCGGFDFVLKSMFPAQKEK